MSSSIFTEGYEVTLKDTDPSKPYIPTFGELDAIARLVAIGDDYATNFYYLVNKHVGTGGPFRMGEYMLSHIERNRLVPFDTLVEMNYYYYSTYDEDFDHSITKELMGKELEETVGRY